MRNSDIPVGRKVFLAADHGWGKHDGNPLTYPGAVHESDLGGWVKIRWDNWQGNSYKANGTDLIPVLHQTREQARKAAKRNPNLKVVKGESSWKLEVKKKLVMDDDGIPAY